MKYFKVLTLITILCLITSCIPTPKRVGIRGAIRQDALTFLDNGPVSREDVLLRFGMPEGIYNGERMFDYKWITSWEYEYGIAPPGGGIAGGNYEEQKCNILRFYFDENGILEDIYPYSYKPNALLYSNKSCYLDTLRTEGPNAKLIDSAIKKILEDYTSVENGVFIAGSRTKNHLRRSGQDVYYKTISDLVSFFQSKEVLINNNKENGIPQINQPVIINKLMEIATESGAGSLLHVTVDRPITSWIVITLRHYHLSGNVCWEEKVSSGGWTLTGGWGLARALNKLKKKLGARIDNNSFFISSDGCRDPNGR